MQPKNKPINRRKYDATFKDDVLKMIANGQTVAYVSQALGISEALIYNRDGGPLEATDERAATAREEKYHPSNQAPDIAGSPRKRPIKRTKPSKTARLKVRS